MKKSISGFTTCIILLSVRSPVYLDDSVRDMDVAVKRIIWGKLVNAGQVPERHELWARSREHTPTVSLPITVIDYE